MLTENQIDNLEKIDKSITIELEKLTSLISSIPFKEITTFELKEGSFPIAEDVFKKKGVYFFEIKNTNIDETVESWINSFSEKWKNTDVTWVPGIKKIRINSHQRFGEWIPLYIGKSKNIGGRIYEHIHQEKNKTTFSMKLRARTNLYGTTFRVSWLPLNVANYSLIAPEVELLLRNKYNPIVGKQ